MTPPELPDDVSQWPRDPHAVLGVRADVDAGGLRRAYAQLARRYKPEHAPEQFRRIREAYEDLRRRLSWRHSAYHVDPDESGDIDRCERDGPRRSEADRGSGGASKAESPTDVAETGWRLAEAGNWVQAYAQLKSSAEKQAGDEEIAVRLYWLIRLRRELDPARSPIDCLMPVLQRTGVRGRVGELYLRALADDPEEACSDRCGALLRDPRSRGLMLELARTRWRAAANADQWYLILTELNRMQDDLLDDTPAWLSLHLIALELAAYAEHDSAGRIAERCAQFFAAEESIALQYPALFDKAEYLLAVAGELRSLGSPLRIRDAWERNDALLLIGAIRRLAGRESGAIRAPLLRTVEEWLCDAPQALAVLSSLQDRCPAIAFTLWQLIDGFIDWTALQPIQLGRPELMQVLQRDLVSGRRISDVSNTADYGRLRGQLLRFCLDEFADLDNVAQALIEVCPGVAAGEHSWPWKLRRDMALRTLVRGGLWFWSQSG